MDKIKKYLCITVVAVAVIAVWILIEFNNYIEQNTTEYDRYQAGAYDLSTMKSVNEIKSTDEIWVGKHLKFGKYEQDNNKYNGSEDIEWCVLAIEDGKALLISEKLLDYITYHDKWENVTWETCSLREWLNEDFYKKAFGFFERGNIALTTLDNSANEEYGTVSCTDTQDKIFVLSIDEVLEYFNSDEDMQASVTDYALGYSTEKRPYPTNESWWLRSMYHSEYYHLTATVSIMGGIDKFKEFSDSTYTAVRPAMWVEIG